MKNLDRNKVDIVSPRKIYALHGKEQTEQINIYFANCITGNLSNYIINVDSKYGKQYQDFWRLDTNNDIENDFEQNASSDLKISALDYDFNVLAECKTSVKMVLKENTDSLRLLCIGDSITRQTHYIEQVKESLPGVKMVGIRTYNEGTTCMEGRGGWTVQSYFRAGNPEGGDSPFMFPKGVEGSIYYGNTEFWKDVVSRNPEAYSYLGFQKIARGWGEQDDTYIFNGDGYPYEPQLGGVVYNPTKPEHQQFLQWKGNEWSVMESQPQWEFDFSKYMERFCCAFIENGTFCPPDVISILLGANDFHQTKEGTDDRIEPYLIGIEKMISSIKKYSNNIKIIINLPVGGTGQDGIGGCKGIAERYRRNMQQVARFILDKWDNVTQEEAGIYISPMLLGLDPVFGFDTIEAPANKYVDTIVSRQSNWVHPNVSGNKQMGDYLAGVLQKIRNEK